MVLGNFFCMYWTQISKNSLILMTSPLNIKYFYKEKSTNCPIISVLGRVCEPEKGKQPVIQDITIAVTMCVGRGVDRQNTLPCTLTNAIISRCLCFRTWYLICWIFKDLFVQILCVENCRFTCSIYKKILILPILLINAVISTVGVYVFCV